LPLQLSRLFTATPFFRCEDRTLTTCLDAGDSLQISASAVLAVGTIPLVSVVAGNREGQVTVTKGRNSQSRPSGEFALGRDARKSVIFLCSTPRSCPWNNAPSSPTTMSCYSPRRLLQNRSITPQCNKTLHLDAGVRHIAVEVLVLEHYRDAIPNHPVLCIDQLSLAVLVPGCALSTSLVLRLEQTGTTWKKKLTVMSPAGVHFQAINLLRIAAEPWAAFAVAGHPPIPAHIFRVIVEFLPSTYDIVAGRRVVVKAPVLMRRSPRGRSVCLDGTD